MYVLFRVPPYSQNIARALIKPSKGYFFDNGDVSEEQGPRFENLVAATLLKRLHDL
jgi:predicted AAA+ superfamily ATPase